MMRMIYGRAGAVKFLTRQSRAGPSRTRPRVFPVCGFALKGKRPDGGFRAIRAMAARGEGLPVGVAADKARKLYVSKNGGALGEKRMPAEIKTMAVDGALIVTVRQSERNGEKLVGLPEQMEWYTKPELELAPAKEVRQGGVE